MHLQSRSLLLLLSFLSQGSWVRSASLPTEMVRMKNTVNTMAEQLVRKINTNISFPSYMVKSSPSGDYYVCSVVQYLNISSGLISNRFSHALELKGEMASLSGYVDQARQCHCSSRPMSTVPRELQDLQAQDPVFFHSISPSTFHLVKEYLKKLQMNWNQLNKCTKS